MNVISWPRTLFIVLWFAAFIAPAAAAIESANDLLSACEDFERNAKVQGGQISITNSVSGFHASECLGYMGAFQHISVFDGSDGTPILKACLPSTTTRTQLIRVFTNYARSHPERLHIQAGVIATKALQSAFPCAH